MIPKLTASLQYRNPSRVFIYRVLKILTIISYSFYNMNLSSMIRKAHLGKTLLELLIVRSIPQSAANKY